MATNVEKKKGFFEHLMELIGVVQYDEEGMQVEETDMINDEYDSQSFVERELEKRFASDRDVVGDSAFSMKLIKPKTHVEAQIIIDSLKNKQPVIVNLEDNDVEEGQRVIDFVSGAVYALGGEVKHISKKIFAIVPDTVSIAE